MLTSVIGIGQNFHIGASLKDNTQVICHFFCCCFYILYPHHKYSPHYGREKKKKELTFITVGMVSLDIFIRFQLTDSHHLTITLFKRQTQYNSVPERKSAVFNECALLVWWHERKSNCGRREGGLYNYARIRSTTTFPSSLTLLPGSTLEEAGKGKVEK